MAGLFSEHMNLRVAALMLIGILIFTLVFEHLTESLEHRLQHMKHYAAILDKCYRELMILGFISLGVVFSNEFHLWHDHDDLLAFEFAHLLVFGVSMVYVLTTVIASNRLHQTSNHWTRMGNADTDEMIDQLEAEIAAGRGDSKGFGPLWKSTINIFSVDLWEDAAWKSLRLLFLEEFDLGIEFDYSKYVTMKLHHKLEHSLHIHPSAWTLVMILSALFFSFHHLLIGAPADEGHRRLGGDQLMEDESGSFAEDGEVSSMTMVALVAPAILGWALMFGQIWVLRKAVIVLIQVLKQEPFECSCANQLPDLMRKLDAKMEMKHILPSLPMFQNHSADFIKACLNEMTLKLFNPGERVFEQGAVGSSMVIICKGTADVQLSDGKVVGTLNKGDYTSEGSLDADTVRSASIVAHTRCAIYELDRSALTPIGEDFPGAVAELLEYVAERAEAARQGDWGAQKDNVADHEEVVAAHAKRLAELKMMQEKKAKDPQLKLKLARMTQVGKKDLVKGAKAGAHAAAHGAHAAGQALVSPSPLIQLIKQVASHCGIPGTGIVRHHSNTEHSMHLDRMHGTAKIMPPSRSQLFEEISELTLLFNCFTVGYYMLHMGPVLIPYNFGGLGAILAHFIVLLPALLLMILVAPVSTKYTCLLDCVIFKDQDTIAEVYHAMTQLITQKNAIKKMLMQKGMKMAHDMGIDDVQIDIAEIAGMMFKEIDTRGEDELNYEELRNGLANFQVYLSKVEFKNIMECIDPDMNGSINCEEWVDFLRASDDQIASDEWKSIKALMAVRKRLSAELIRKVMTVEKPDATATVESLMTTIFRSMDTDGSESLDDNELREGLIKYGISISPDDQQVVSNYIAKECNDGEMPLSQWLDFVKAQEAAQEVESQGGLSSFEVEGSPGTSPSASFNSNGAAPDPFQNPLAKDGGEQVRPEMRSESPDTAEV